jgi:hypothetical protein
VLRVRELLDRLGAPRAGRPSRLRAAALRQVLAWLRSPPVLHPDPSTADRSPGPGAAALGGGTRSVERWRQLSEPERLAVRVVVAAGGPLEWLGELDRVRPTIAELVDLAHWHLGVAGVAGERDAVDALLAAAPDPDAGGQRAQFLLGRLELVRALVRAGRIIDGGGGRVVPAAPGVAAALAEEASDVLHHLRVQLPLARHGWQRVALVESAARAVRASAVRAALPTWGFRADGYPPMALTSPAWDVLVEHLPFASRDFTALIRSYLDARGGAAGTRRFYQRLAEHLAHRHELDPDGRWARALDAHGPQRVGEGGALVGVERDPVARLRAGIPWRTGSPSRSAGDAVLDPFGAVLMAWDPRPDGRPGAPIDGLTVVWGGHDLVPLFDELRPEVGPDLGALLRGLSVDAQLDLRFTTAQAAALRFEVGSAPTSPFTLFDVLWGPLGVPSPLVGLLGHGDPEVVHVHTWAWDAEAPGPAR